MENGWTDGQMDRLTDSHAQTDRKTDKLTEKDRFYRIDYFLRIFLRHIW